MGRWDAAPLRQSKIKLPQRTGRGPRQVLSITAPNGRVCRAATAFLPKTASAETPSPGQQPRGAAPSNPGSLSVAVPREVGNAEKCNCSTRKESRSRNGRTGGESPRDHVEQHQHEQDHQQGSQDSAGAIAPTARMRPGRHGAQQQQDHTINKMVPMSELLVVQPRGISECHKASIAIDMPFGWARGGAVARAQSETGAKGRLDGEIAEQMSE